MIRILIAALTLASACSAGTIIVNLPAGLDVKSATATPESKPQTPVAGKLDAAQATFDVADGTAYEIDLTLADGTVLAGVDLGWYSRVPDKKDADELSDDDKQQMLDVVKKVLSFYNKNDALIWRGNHNRCVVLVDHVNDEQFHSNSGDEVIWRPELWYFQNNHGGWEKVQQTDRVLRRVRFKTPAEYHAVVDKLQWTPQLGGLKTTSKQPTLKVTAPKAGTAATTQAAK